MVPRFTDFLDRYRFVLAGTWILHATALHLIFIGFVSWDALWYRVPPIIELVQHGHYNFDKFQFQVHTEFVPFTELVHAPFLRLFGLPGLLVGYPLVVFPLCLWAIASFVEEVTGDRRARIFGTLAYAAIPTINQQPFSGYVDFIVTALLALFLFAVLRLRSEQRLGRGFLRLALATFALTMARQHGVYMVVLFLPPLLYVSFFERHGFRPRVSNARALRVALAGILVGAAPVIAIQLRKLVVYGSPIYPYQFKVLGFASKAGVPLETYLGGGLSGASFRDYVSPFVSSWIWPRTWENLGFFDGRYLGGGFVFCISLALLPLFLRGSSRTERWLAASCAIVSLLSHDFIISRYSYALIPLLVLIIGRALSLAAEKRLHALFWPAAVLLLAHLLRPEADIALILHGNGPRPRVNVTRSSRFLRPPVPDGFEIEPYPDLGAKFVAIETVANGFFLPIYGARLSNEVLPSPSGTSIGRQCENLAPVIAKYPDVLFVDDLNYAKDCERECVLPLTYGCRAYRIRPH